LNGLGLCRRAAASETLWGRAGARVCEENGRNRGRGWGPGLTVAVLVAVGVRLYRDAVAEILARDESIDVVGTAADPGDLFVRIAQSAPDVIVLDPALLRSPEAIQGLGSRTGIKVVVLVSSDAEPAIVASAEAGAAGFVTRDDSLADLVATILSASRGELICSPRLAGTLLRRVSTLAAERSDHSELRLTIRELEVARLVDVGLSNKQIAARLGIELPTVKHHVHHILEKLGVDRRGAAVARLRERGVLPPSVVTESTRD
jgi:two-component system nitrate/nitrite response regulator NarL